MGFRASAVFALAAVLCAGSPLEASAAGACSSDTFAIDNTSLGIAICEAPPHGNEGILTETLTVAGRPPLVRTATYPRVGGTSRTIDDIALGPLGIGKTLHVTVAVRPGSVRVEHALLVPGAIPLK